MIAVKSAGMTDVGQLRSANEDALLVDDIRRLYVVADGMGGHLAGEVASSLVVDTMSRCISKHNMGTGQRLIFNVDPNLSEAANRLVGGINFANREVFKQSHANEVCRGMGSTVSAVYITDQTLVAANVGDSPIYLVRQGETELLSVPHTILHEKGELVVNESSQTIESLRHVLTRAIGPKASVAADVCEIQCFPEDIVIICSDGLSDKLESQEISGMVIDSDPYATCRSLIGLANHRGGDDNITVIVLMLSKINTAWGRYGRLVSRFFGKN